MILGLSEDWSVELSAGDSVASKFADSLMIFELQVSSFFLLLRSRMSLKNELAPGLFGRRTYHVRGEGSHPYSPYTPSV